MHMAIAAVVNAAVGPAGQAGGSAAVAAAGRLSPEELVDLVDFRYLTDALTPDEALEILRAAPAGARRARGAAAAGGLPRLHDVARLARLRRRQAAPAVPGGGRGRLHPDQAEGRRGPGRRRPADGHRPRGLRAGHPDRRRRQPALGRGRGDRRGSRALAPFDPSGSRSRPAPTTCSGTPTIARALAPIPVATGEHVAEPGHLQAAAPGSARSPSCRSTRPGWPGSTRTSRSCCWPRSSGCRSARTPAGWACASWSSTCRCSTSSRWPARCEDRVIEYVDHLHEHFVDPVVIRRGRYLAPTGAGFSATMRPRTLADYAYPDGPVWTATAEEGRWPCSGSPCTPG